jgi:hypothetical protein
MEEEDRKCGYDEIEDLIQVVKSVFVDARLALSAAEGKHKAEYEALRGRYKAVFPLVNRDEHDIQSLHAEIASLKETHAKELREAFEAGFVCGHSRQNSKSGFDEFLTQKETK